MPPKKVQIHVNGRSCHFDPDSILGKGNKGTVILGGDDNEFVARKLESKDFKIEELRRAIEELIRLIPHENLLRTYAVEFQEDQCYIIGG